MRLPCCRLAQIVPIPDASVMEELLAEASQKLIAPPPDIFEGVTEPSPSVEVAARSVSSATEL